jgi:DNA-directed RNA polymerase subunit RPC12/RpoP
MKCDECLKEFGAFDLAQAKKESRKRHGIVKCPYCKKDFIFSQSARERQWNKESKEKFKKIESDRMNTHLETLRKERNGFF